MQWLARNHELVSSLTGIGMLLVWLVYLQVFVSSYRRQLRAKLLITRSTGEGFEARCFVSNMSAGPVYVQSIILSVETADGTIVCPVTDLLDLEDEAPGADPQSRTRQGPLLTGQLKDIGAFGSLLKHATSYSKRSLAASGRDVRSMTVEILGVYGAEDLLVGARRRFIVETKDGKPRIRGEDVSTEQVRSRRQRRKLTAELMRDP
jgi:hypothetical protein